MYPKTLKESQGTGIAKAILKKKKSCKTHTSDFKTDYKATVIKRVWCPRKDAHGDPQGRTESPAINTHMYRQGIFSKGAKPFNGERTVFSSVVLGTLDIHMPKNEVEPFPNTMYKNQLKMDQKSISWGKRYITRKGGKQVHQGKFGESTSPDSFNHFSLTLH